MIKFKEGDIVRRNSDEGGAPRILLGVDLEVTTGGGYDDIITVRDVCRDETGRLYGNRFVLVETEELPPAPDSVMYFNSNATHGNDQRLIVDTTRAGEIVVNVVRRGRQYKPYDRTNALSVGLEPDDAIQLAHDIYRMARAAKKAQEV